MIFWRKRRLPTRKYQKYWHYDECYIQTGVVWNETHFVARFQLYSDFRAQQRLP